MSPTRSSSTSPAARRAPLSMRRPSTPRSWPVCIPTSTWPGRWARWRRSSAVVASSASSAATPASSPTWTPRWSPPRCCAACSATTPTPASTPSTPRRWPARWAWTSTSTPPRAASTTPTRCSSRSSVSSACSSPAPTSTGRHGSRASTTSASTCSLPGRFLLFSMRIGPGSSPQSPRSWRDTTSTSHASCWAATAPAAVHLGGVPAPPYDVIDDVQREALYARDLRNLVRVDYGQDLPDDVPGSSDRYTRAAEHLEAWRSLGVLVREARDAYYVTEHQFIAPDGSRHARRGVIARVRAAPWTTSDLRPHEHTLRGPKEDRLALMRATDTQTSPVFAVCRRR